MLLALVLGGALAGVGCGGGEEEEEAVEASVREFWAAFVDGDPRAFCDALAPEALDQVFANLDRTAPQTAGADCPRAFATVAPELPEGFRAQAREIEVTDVRVDGDRATAQVRPRAATQPGGDEVGLRRSGDRWLISVTPLTGTEETGTSPAPANVTREEAIERADALCAQAAQRSDELVDELDLSDPADQRALDERSLEIERDLGDGLATLSPPAEQRPTFDRFAVSVDLAADLREDGLEAVAAGDQQAADEAVAQLAVVVQEGQRAAVDYGLRECARIGQG
jgi:hypothetical protein